MAPSGAGSCTGGKRWPCIAGSDTNRDSFSRGASELKGVPPNADLLKAMVAAESRRAATARFQVRLAHKFFLVLSILAAAIVAVGLVGALATAAMQEEVDGIYADNVRTSQLTTALGSSLDDAADSALQLIPTTDRGVRDRLNKELDREIIPAVTQSLQPSGVRTPTTRRSNALASSGSRSGGEPSWSFGRKAR